MNSQTSEADRLIQRLKQRAADADRRVDSGPSVFDQRVQSLDLASLAAELMRAGGDLRRMVAANQEGNLPRDLTAKAEGVAADMATPAPSSLTEPATEDRVRAAEADLGFSLPALLRRIYLEVADGGFGPSDGLLSLREMVALYHELLAGEVLPRGRQWPGHLLPVVRESQAVVGVDRSSPEGQIVAWDEDGLEEFVTAAEWAAAFKGEAPSLAEWLTGWLDGPSPQAGLQTSLADRIMANQVEEARKARARFAAMTPEQRAEIGLPEVGWEKVVWGGLGWDEP